MWFNDWLDVKRVKDSLEIHLSFRKYDEPTLSIGPIVAPYPTITIWRNPYPPGGSSEKPIFHSYPTDFLTESDAAMLKKSLSDIVGVDHVRFVGTTEVYDAIMQRAGIELRPDPYKRLVVQLVNVQHKDYLSLPENLRARLIDGRYKFQARRQMGFPVRKAVINQALEDIARPLKEINDRLFAVANRPKREAIDVWEFAYSQAKAFTALIKAADHDADVIINNKTRQAEIHLSSLRPIEYLQERLTSDEVVALGMRFFDTEQKFFAYHNSSNCFIGVLDCLDRTGLEGRIYTTEDYFKERIECKFNGSTASYNIHYFQTEIEMVESAALSFRAHNPPITLAQHINHDVMKLRSVKRRKSHKGFPVGIGRAEPRKAVSLNFFTRIECPGRIILDTMRLSMILDPHLPANHLEIITGLEKGITYQEFDRLTRDGDPQGRRMDYLGLDILSMAHHVIAGPWKDRLALIPAAAIGLGVSITEAAFSPSCAKNYLDWQYFLDKGTYRITPNQRSGIMKAEKIFRDKWRSDLIGEALFDLTHPGSDKTAQSLPDGVYDARRVYIPLGKVMMNKFILNVPYFTMHHRWQYLSNLDRISLCQYLNALTYEPWLHIAMTRDYSRTSDLDQKANMALLKSACSPSPSSPAVSYYIARKAFKAALQSKMAAGRFWYRHGFSQEEWMGFAKSYARRIGAALVDSGCRVVARDGLWLYLDKDIHSGFKYDLVPLDQVRLFKFTKNGLPKVIFKERGIYHGIKLDPDKPKLRTMHESKVLYDVLDAIINNDLSRASQVYNKGLADLIKGRVRPRELLFKRRKLNSSLNNPDADALLPEQGKIEYSFLGLDKGGTELFSYNEYENGLDRFDPDWEAYVKRFHLKVGYYLRKGIRILKSQSIGKQGKLF